MTIPSSLDSTVAPPGCHVVQLFTQYTPYSLADGEWTEERKAEYADKCKYSRPVVLYDDRTALTKQRLLRQLSTYGFFCVPLGVSRGWFYGFKPPEISFLKMFICFYMENTKTW